MTSKTRIAVLVAALFLGTQAGIAALTQEAPEVTAEAAESTEAVEIAEAPATEPAAAEPAAAETPEATAAAEQPAVATPAPAHVLFDSDVFPRTAEVTDMLPGLIAYLEQREATIRHLVARGDAFPTPSESPMLPALAAYLEQKEALLVARLQQDMQASTATPVAFATQQAARSN
jgi:hypothetical protein